MLKPSERQTISAARALVLLLPLLALYLAVAALGWNRPAVHDETPYLKLAAHFAPGVEKPAGELNLWLSPGYGLFLAPFTALGFKLGLLRLLNAVLLFAGILFFYRFLAAFFAPRRAMIGAWLLGLYFPIWKLLPALMSETLAVCLVCFVLWSWSKILRAPAISWRWIISGACALAWLCLTRVIFGYAVAFCGLLWLTHSLLRREAPRSFRLTWLHILALALCLPWLITTWARTHKPFYWTCSGGLSLYWMTSPFPGEWGDWLSPENVLTNDSLARHRPLVRKAEKFKDAARDDIYKTAAFRNLRNHPFKYLKNVAANISRIFFSFPYTRTPQKLSTLFYAIPNALLLTFFFLAVVGIARMGRAEASVVLPYALFGGVAFFGTALLSAYPRMLFPLIPVILFIILYGLRHARLGPEKRTPSKP